jgi:ABC-type dipeptide/oligopeptide/nickel transport system permease component
MLLRLFRRFFSMILVLDAAGLLAFLILDVTPGDAAQAVAGESASAEEMAVLRQQMGLDRPVLVRYLAYLDQAAQGDLGKSLVSGRPVAQMIGERFASTLLLAVTATLFATLPGLAIGIWAAARQGKPADLGVMSLAALGMAVPGYGLAMLLTLFFSLKLRLLPVAGGGDWKHLVLPALTLALPLLAVVARISRSSLLDAAQADYVLAAKARGVSATRVWWKHILKNALIPVVTLVSLNFGHLLGGAFVVETIYGWPGLGRMTVQAVFDRDTPVILGAVLLLALIYQLFNLLADLAHGLLDPRSGNEAV